MTHVSRRNVLGAGLFAWLVGIITLPFRVGRAATAKETTDAEVSQPKHIDPAKDKILLAGGWTLPSIRLGCVTGEPKYRYAVSPGTEQPESIATNKIGAPWLEQPWTGVRPDCYPRPSHFRVCLETKIGTIDEIVAEFRENLITAVDVWAQPDTPWGDAVLAGIAQLTEKYPAGVTSLSVVPLGRETADFAEMSRQQLATQAADAAGTGD